MKYELKSIGLWSFVKVSFFFNLVAGFILGFLYALLVPLLLTVAGNMPGMSTMTPEFEELRNVSLLGLVIVMPIITALMAAAFNTIVGSVVVLIYNLLARLVGGLEFKLEQRERYPAGYVSPEPTPGYAGPSSPSSSAYQTSPVPPGADHRVPVPPPSRLRPPVGPAPEPPPAEGGAQPDSKAPSEPDPGSAGRDNYNHEDLR